MHSKGGVKIKVNWYATVALLFFNLVFVLGIAIGVYALLGSLWIVMGTFVLSPFLLIAINLLEIQDFSVLQSMASFFLFFVGDGLIPVCQKSTKYLMKWSLDYINFNKKIIYGTTI